MSKMSDFESSIASAKKYLKQGDYPLAEQQIKNAMTLNPHSAEVHNLYGILEELLNEDNLAHKHYQAANALDPSYTPAMNNLERVTIYAEHTKTECIDFGNIAKKGDDNSYIIEYDRNHVGHLIKKGKKQ